jgi:pilus assembly protein Flp/PilA
VLAERQDRNHSEETPMQELILKFYVKSQSLKSILQNEEGQDLIEYALVVALIALGAVAGMGTLATGINNAFGTIASKLASNV